MDPATVPYCGAPTDPAEFLSRWNLDPLLLAMLVTSLLACRMFGGRWRPLIAGYAVLFLLFVSPFCALTSALFSMRVAHHVALTALAAPLLALALPRGGRNVAAWALGHAAIFWIWHTPAAYAFALSSDTAYWLMQVSLFGSALGLWRAVRAAPPPAALAGLLGTMVQMGLLGALLTFATVPLYAWHMATTQPWGLTPLADQQLAGLIMWVPGAGLYLAAALRLAGGWLRKDRGFSAT